MWLKKPVVFLFCVIFSLSKLAGQVIANALPGCLDIIDDQSENCGGVAGYFWGINASNQFEATRSSGATCTCNGSCGSMCVGDNSSYFEFEPIDISSYMNVSISLTYSANTGGPTQFEDFSATPLLGCGTAAQNDGHDQMIFYYRINAGPYVQGLYVNGSVQADFTGIWNQLGLNGNTLQIKVVAVTKSQDESFYFEDLIIQGTPKIINAGPDKTVCGIIPIELMGSGVGTWTGGAGIFSAPNTPTSNYTPDVGELNSTVTLTYSGNPTTPGCASDFPPPSDDMDLTVSSQPEVSLNGGATMCQGDCTDITVSITGGSPPYNVTLNISSIPFPIMIPITPSIDDKFTVCYESSSFPFPTYNASTKTISVPANFADQTISIIISDIDDGGNCPGIIDNSPITFNFLRQPQATNANIEVCDDGSGTAVFDLTSIEAEILGSEIGVVRFYDGPDRFTDTELFSPISSGSQTIYAIIESINGCFSTAAEVDLIIKPPGNVGTVALLCNNDPTCIICDTDNTPGIDVDLKLNLATNGVYTVVIDYIINGITFSITEVVTGPNPIISVNIDADAIFLVKSVQLDDNCPDFTGLGTVSVDYVLAPVISNVNNIITCNNVSLPPISVDNPGSTTAYFTGTQGTGTRYNPGEVVSSSLVLYAFSGTLPITSCYDEEILVVNIGGATTYTQPQNITQCGFYVLGPINGTNVGPNTRYFTAQNGGGNIYNQGDTIKSSIVLYIFDPTNVLCQTNQPSFSLNITPAPSIKLDSIVKRCDTYRLPVITGTNLPLATYYYSNPQHTGNIDTIGTPVTKTDTFYILAGSGLCKDNDTLIINIQKSTEYLVLGDINECNSFELPPIAGTNVLNTSMYFTQINGMGTAYLPGDIITSPTLLFVFDTLNKCQLNQPSFLVNVTPGPEISSISDTTLCTYFILPQITGINLTGSAAYFSGQNGSGTKYNSGDTIKQSQVLYAFEKNVSCNTQEVFNVTIENKPNSGISKTIGICFTLDLSINLFDLLQGNYDAGGVWTSTNPNFDVSDPTNVKVPGNLPQGLYAFNYRVNSVSCQPSVTFSNLGLIAEANAGPDSTVTICEGSVNTIKLIDFLKPNDKINGKWSGPINVPTAQAVIDISALTEGEYNFKYLLTNTVSGLNNICRDSANLKLKVVKGFNAGLDNAISACTGNNIIDLIPLVNQETEIGIFKDPKNTGKLSGSEFNTSGLIAGIYDLYHIIPSKGGCAADTSIIKININNQLSAGPDVAQTLCNVSPFDLSSLIANQYKGGNFEFDGVGGSLIGNTFNPAIDATFEIKYKVGDGLICPVDEASITLTFVEKPAALLDNDESICENDDILYLITGENGFKYTIILQNQNQFNSGSNLSLEAKDINATGVAQPFAFNFIPIPGQKYYIKVVSAQKGNCSFDLKSDDIVKIITTRQNSTKNIADEYCKGQKVKIANVEFSETNSSDTIKLNSASGCDSLLYVNLNFKNNSSSDFNYTSCKNDYSFTLEGKTFDINNPIDTVLLSIKNALGCDSIVNVKLNFGQPSTDITVQDALCENQNGRLIITNSTLGLNLDVYVNNFKTENIKSYPFNISLFPGTYKIKLENSDGCFTENNLVINVDDAPEARIEEVLLPDGKKQLNLIASTDITDIVWSPSSAVSCTDCPNPIILEFGEVKVQFNYGVDCPLELSYLVAKEVIKEIYFPNVIISNEGGNSIFYPYKPNDYKVIGISMKIYDRWGNVLYQVNNFEIGKPEYGWDGTFNSKKVNPGVYLYTLEVKDIDNVITKFLGDITVVR